MLLVRPSRSYRWRTVSAGALALAAVVAAAVPATASSLLDVSAVRLVQPVGSSRLYAVVSGRKYLVRSSAILRSYGFRQQRPARRPVGEVGAIPDVRLVRSPLGPRVYLLDQPRGQKLWVPTEASFIQSGGTWPEVLEISGEDSRAYRNAEVVRVADSPVVYHIDYASLTRTVVSGPSELTAAGYSWADVLTVPKALLAAYEVRPPADGSPSRPPSGAAPPPSPGVAVQVSGTIGPGGTIPSGTSRNKIWDIHLTAAGGPSQVTGLRLTKTGFLRDSDVEGITVTDDRGILLTSPQRFVEGAVAFSFREPIPVAVGQPRILTVAVNLAAAIGATQGSFTAAIAGPADVVATVPVQGSFPLRSPTYRVITGSAVVGRLTVDSVELAATPRSVIIGTTAQALNRFEFAADGSPEDVLLDRLTFAQLGSGRSADFTKFRLVDDGNRTVAADGVVSGRAVVLSFGRTPYRVPKGERRTLTLQADIVGGADSTSQYVIQNDYEVEARGESLGYAVSVTAGPLEGGFPVGDRSSPGFNALRVEPGHVLISLNPQSPTGGVSRGAEEAVLATFDVQALGTALLWQRVGIKVTASAPRTPLADAVTLRVRGGAILGSIGPASVMDRVSPLSLATPLTIQSGRTVTIEAVAGISATASTTDQYAVELSNGEFVVPGTTERVTFSGAVAGASRTVQELILLVRHDPRFTAANTAAGTRGVVVGRFLFQPSAGERVRIEQVTLAAVGGTALVRFSDGFSNLRLGGATLPAPTGSPHLFPLGAEINAGGEVAFDVVLDTTAAVDGQTVQLVVQDVIARGVTSRTKVTVNLAAVTTPAVTFRQSVITFSQNGAFAGGVATRTAATVIGSFTVAAAGAESIVVPELTITEAVGSSGLSAPRGYRNLRLIDAGNGRTISATVGNPVSGAGGNLLGGGPTLQPGQTLTVNIVVDATAASAGDTLQMRVSTVKTEGRTSHLPATVSGLVVTSPAVTL